MHDISKKEFITGILFTNGEIVLYSVQVYPIFKQSVDITICYIYFIMTQWFSFKKRHLMRGVTLPSTIFFFSWLFKASTSERISPYPRFGASSKLVGLVSARCPEMSPFLCRFHSSHPSKKKSENKENTIHHVRCCLRKSRLQLYVDERTNRWRAKLRLSRVPSHHWSLWKGAWESP